MRGIIVLCIGLFVFSLHDIGVKLLSGTYPVSQVLFVRSFTALPLLLLLVHLDGGLRMLAAPRLAWVALRSMLLLIGYVVYYLGFAAIPFADAVAIYASTPLIIAALAGPLLGERVGLIRWVAVGVGFGGVLVMFRPGVGVFEPAGLLILLCALMYSLAMVMTRAMGPLVPASVMSFYSTASFLVVAVVLGLLFGASPHETPAHPSLAFLLRPWAWPTWPDALIMMSCGVTAGIGVASLSFAYREGEANQVASFEYTALLWASLWGFLIWSEVPQTTTFVGAFLIVGAGLVALMAGRRVTPG